MTDWESHAHVLALELQCVLMNPDRFWHSAWNAIEAYRKAVNDAYPSDPTFMGEPVLDEETYWKTKEAK